MNAKIVATLAVAVMVFAGVAAVVSMDDVSAADGDIINHEKITVSGADSSAELDLVVTQSQFAGYAHVLKWYATEAKSGDVKDVDDWGQPIGTSSYAADSVGTGDVAQEFVQGEGYKGTGNTVQVTVDLKRTSSEGATTVSGVLGQYVFTFTPGFSDSDNNTEEKVYWLKCQIELETSTHAKESYAIYYTVPVMESLGTDLDTMFFSDVNGVVGQYYGKSIDEIATAKKNTGDGTDSYTKLVQDYVEDVKNYFWYAQGLPAGLAMSEDGFISGIPMDVTNGKFSGYRVTYDANEMTKITGVEKLTTAEEGVAVVTVTAILKDTQEKMFTGELVVKITRDSSIENTFLNKYKYEVTVGTGTSAPTYTNPISVIVETDQVSDVVLKTYTKAIDSGDDTSTNMTVHVIGDDGKKYSVQPVVGSTGEYRLPISGTGAYKVVMTAPASGPTEQFYLFVTAQLGEVVPGIIPTGN